MKSLLGFPTLAECSELIYFCQVAEYLEWLDATNNIGVVRAINFIINYSSYYKNFVKIIILLHLKQKDSDKRKFLNICFVEFAE